MKLQFKHQKFQADAARAVVDVFAGQPYLTPTHCMDFGQESMEIDATGWHNGKIVPELTDAVVLEHLNKVQRANRIPPSPKLEGHYNLTIEMETGVGKTYTYIKTIYELNRRYGWSKFIVVTPSVAIREGVYKTFQMTEEHFAEEYGRRIRFFIYNSSRLDEIDRFASESSIHVMIINSQAFNARDQESRRISMKLDTFRSRRPIDVIAKTNPILIIDEPQSVEGKQTKERLKDFCPLFTLRYSATHRPDSLYNMVYCLDAMEAYNKRLVKKIEVKGISESCGSSTEGYLYLESINLSKADPTATLQFDYKGASQVRKKTMQVKTGFDLYQKSNGMEEYRNNFIVAQINGRDGYLEFLNGVKVYTGEVLGKVNEEQFRRIQIRETILSHIERERQLFHKGVKVLSLFFIDEVAKYRAYDADGKPVNGMYAEMFEQEYAEVLRDMRPEIEDAAYLRYLDSISAAQTHTGYFSIDKKGRMTDSKLSDKKAGTSDDADAYDLIMRNKELLLSRSGSPVRFLFSHSALREGWDNPNVFQICTLKQSGSEVRKRQEVGRGLRLCVNQDGERMDANLLGEDVHQVNVLTVIASESYEDFAAGLQRELAEAVTNRPAAVSASLFQGKTLRDSDGNEQIVDGQTAQAIYFDLVVNGYVDRDGALTDRYYVGRADGAIQLSEDVADCAGSIFQILDAVYNSRMMQPGNARDHTVTLKIDPQKLAMAEFQNLWQRISRKSAYAVDFDDDALTQACIASINRNLRVSKVLFRVETGVMEQIESQDALLQGGAFSKIKSSASEVKIPVGGNVKYDLIGKIAEGAGLTRKAAAAILQGIRKDAFEQFRENPEDFILKVSALINDEKAAAILPNIAYQALEERWPESLLTDHAIQGKLDVNARKAVRHLYDHVVYDSQTERDFSKGLDTNPDIAVYIKLPRGFSIPTPAGRYTPDWAIAFRSGTAKCSYWVVETKGSADTLRFNHISPVEQAKIDCAKAHFQAISGGEVAFAVVDSYDTLLQLLGK